MKKSPRRSCRLRGWHPDLELDWKRDTLKGERVIAKEGVTNEVQKMCLTPSLVSLSVGHSSGERPMLTVVWALASRTRTRGIACRLVMAVPPCRAITWSPTPPS